MLSIFENAEQYDQRIALREKNQSYTYKDLVKASTNIASALLSDTPDLKEERIGFLISPSFNYVSILWGIWKAGGIGVPLSLSATESELTHYLEDAKISLLISDNEGCKKLKKLSDDLNIPLEDEKNLQGDEDKALPEIKKERKAMILFTSGTTSKPKGVVSTHSNIEAQISSLVDAWEWHKDDFIPLILPLHHIHGIINALSCPLWIGASVDILGAFEVEKVVEAVCKNNYSVFTAVPTIYFSLIDKIEHMAGKELELIQAKFKEMRLMMSGSAALAPEIHKKWSELTGQDLLERYGMTEIGMALSNPLKGEKRPGSVGQALPEVEICLMEDNKVITEENTPGEIMIKGPQVFLEYWNQEKTTEDSFFEGWFKTGDVAELIDGYYKILGRASVDIIKSGGYKISALEIEDVLLKHPLVKECAVIGIADKKWGEVVAATIIASDELTLEDIQAWSLDFLSDYKIPRSLKLLEELPKNAMGKVVKPEIKKLF
jgi:malonyl-CoA/methylmalonyl-CoA synthetase